MARQPPDHGTERNEPRQGRAVSSRNRRTSSNRPTQLPRSVTRPDHDGFSQARLGAWLLFFLRSIAKQREVVVRRIDLKDLRATNPHPVAKKIVVLTKPPPSARSSSSPADRQARSISVSGFSPEVASSSRKARAVGPSTSEPGGRSAVGGTACPDCPSCLILSGRSPHWIFGTPFTYEVQRAALKIKLRPRSSLSAASIFWPIDSGVLSPSRNLSPPDFTISTSLKGATGAFGGVRFSG